MKTHYDLIIVGGGLVGAGFALALHRFGLSIALVEAKPAQAIDQRLFALNFHSCQFLKNIGLYAAVEEQASDILTIHVSRQHYFGTVRLHHYDVELPFLGQVIPASALQAAIDEKIQTVIADNKLALYQPATVTQLHQADNLATLSITMAGQTHTISAPIVIAADGTHSTLRKLANIAVDEVDYQQGALVTQTHLGRSHHQVAYERFTPDGAIAMLPLKGTSTHPHQVATIWTAAHDTLNQLMQLSDDEFVQSLQTNFGYRLGKLHSIKQRFIYPLKMVTAKQSQANCVVLLGNAAHTLHPIAAQGLNLALSEIAYLTQGIANLIKQDTAITAHQILQISQSAFKQHTINLKVSHQLATLFNQGPEWLNVVLQLGMLCFDKLPPVKRLFLQRLLGRTGKLPPLLLSIDNHEIIND